MSRQAEFYVVRRRAVPEVLQKVVEANRLLASGKARTVNDAVNSVGISRSSYYKFKDDIEEFHDSRSGTNLTINCEVDDETGVLSEMLDVISSAEANILTIHQSIPIHGVAFISISFRLPEEDSVQAKAGEILAGLDKIPGVRKVHVTGR